MKRTRTGYIPLTLTVFDDGVRIVVHVIYTPGEDAVHTLPNGDPGYPGSPALAELDTYEAWLHTDLLQPLPPVADEIRIQSEALDEMVQKWVDSEGGQLAAAEAYEAWRDDDAA